MSAFEFNIPEHLKLDAKVTALLDEAVIRLTKFVNDLPVVEGQRWDVTTSPLDVTNFSSDQQVRVQVIARLVPEPPLKPYEIVE